MIVVADASRWSPPCAPTTSPGARRSARRRGCLGFAIRPDPIDPARINGDGCLQALYFRMGSPVPVPISCGRLVVM